MNECEYCKQVHLHCPQCGAGMLWPFPKDFVYIGDPLLCGECRKLQGMAQAVLNALKVA
jgi:hypothetical protein